MPIIGNQLVGPSVEDCSPIQSRPKELQNILEGAFEEYSILLDKGLYQMFKRSCIQDMSPIQPLPNEFQQ